MKNQMKLFFWEFLLFLPRTFGIIKLGKWLLNKDKKFTPKEMLINWLLCIVIIATIIVVLRYTSLTFKYEVKGNVNAKQAEIIDKWGTAIFFLSTIIFVIIPFKVYFMKKRRKLKDEIKN